jgi:hypothetical protein
VQRYQLLLPWHATVQFPPLNETLLARFLTPFMCVAALAVVVLYPEPWQLAQEMPFDAWSEWRPFAGGIAWHVVHDVVGGGGVQLCVSAAGVPPVQPAGADDATVRVCVPLAEHALHGVYVNEEQVTGGGVQVCVSAAGVPPVQPAGERVATVRVWIPAAEQALHAE